MRKYLLSLAMACIALCPALGARAEPGCNSAPKAIETRESVVSTVLVLEARGRYYLLDKCLQVSRSQFGSVLHLGFLNNFPGQEPSYLLVKSRRSFAAPPPDFLKLSRGGGWYLGSSVQSKAEQVAGLEDKAYRGTTAEWNSANADGRIPEDLLTVPKKNQPWHAYIDAGRSAASTDELRFWRIGDGALGPNDALTYYLIRFVPSKSFSLIDFYVYIQEGVSKVEVQTRSNIDALGGLTYTIIVVR
jgi:hypothetical protein